MKITISFDIDPADYGRKIKEHDGVAIATAIYNGYTDPPLHAVVQVDNGLWHNLLFNNGTIGAEQPEE
jgi:hypothetical protein